jgi:hypothetical protein
MHDVRCEIINGVWIPVAASYDSRLEYADGRVDAVTTHYKRLNVDLAPDFEALGAFVPDIRDGIPVADLDFPQVQYKWMGGSFKVAVNNEAIDAITKQVADLSSESPASRASDVGGEGDPRTKRFPVDGQVMDSPKSENSQVLAVACGLVILVVGGALWLHRNKMTRNAAP